jgi:hypothetical protein
MAQKRYWNYEDDDLTVDLNHREGAMIPPGRYAGFKPLAMTGTTLQLVHTDGYKKVSVGLGNSQVGVWVTNQGLVIHEDQQINLPINPNPEDLPRVDLIVGSHEYQLVAGGQQALYSIVQGQPSDEAVPADPTLPEPNKQVILGRLYIEPGANTLADMRYVPAQIPRFSNDVNIPLKSEENSFALKQTVNTLYYEVQRGEIQDSTDSILLDRIDPYDSSSDLASFYELRDTGDTGISGIRTIQRINPTVDTQIGQFIWLYTPVEIHFYTDGYGTSNLYTEEGLGELIMPANRWFCVRRTVSGWLFTHADLANTHRFTKWREMQVWNHASTSLVSGKLGGNAGREKGNIWKLVIESGNNVINWIHAPDHTVIGNEGGRVLVIYVGNGADATIFHDVTTGVPTNYKPIYIPSGQSIDIATGDTLMFVEGETHYYLVGLKETTGGGEGWYPLGYTNSLKFEDYQGYDVKCREQGNLLRFIGAVQINHAQVSGSDIGRVMVLPSQYRPTQERVIHARLYSTDWDFSLVDGGGGESWPVEVIFESISNGGLYIRGGGEITKNAVLRLDGIQIDLKS